MVVAANLVANVSVQGASQAKAELQGVGSSADSASGTLKNLALGGLAIAGTAIVGMGVASVKMAGDFQSGMTTLVTGAGEAQKNIKMVGDGILQMAIDTGTSTKQLTDGMYMIESAGYHGADGLNVLKIAAEGAKVGNADLGTVADALTTILTDYHLKSTDATAAMNALVTTVASGKTHMEDLSKSMGAVLPLASSLHISFPQVAGALATMTNAGMDAQHASQNLANAFRALNTETSSGSTALKDIGLTAEQVHNDLQNKGFAATLQEIEDHIGKKFPLSSKQGQDALKAIMGGATGLNVALMVGGQNMSTYEANIKSITDAMKNGDSAVQGWSDVQNDFNFKMDQAKETLEVLGIKIGTMLLPVLGQILDRVMPVIKGFTDWATSTHALSDTINFFHTNAQIITPVLAGLGAMLLTVLIPAMATFAVEVAIATWPLLAIGAAVAGVALVFTHFYQTNAPFRDFINGLVKDIGQLWTMLQANFLPALTNVGNFMKTTVLPIFQQIGAFLVATFKPVWDQLVVTFKTQILPAWNDLMTAMKPTLPFFQLLGGIILGIIVVALGILVATIAGVVKGFAGMIVGITQAFGGVIQIISGFVQIAGGFIDFFVDLFTGKFNKLGADLGIIWNGIVTMFKGIWNVIVGLFSAAWGLISGIVVGFVQGIIGYFQHLYDMLVGHSIIPDLVNGVIRWFQTMWNSIVSLLGGIGKWFQDRWNEVVSGITAFGQTIVNKFNSIKDSVTNTFHDMINGIVDKLNSGITAVENFVNFFGQGLNNIAKALGASNIIPEIHLGRIPHYAQGTDGHPGGLAIVGEEGPELVTLPKGTSVLNHNDTKSLLSMSNIPGYAGGIGDLFSTVQKALGDIGGWLTQGAQFIVDHIISTLHLDLKMPGGIESLASSALSSIKGWAVGFLNGILPKPGAGGGGGGSAGPGQAVNVPGSVMDWINAAIGLTGVPANWANDLAIIAMHESGGNPNAVNNWDSNAAAGHPSEGLMQTIGPTFAAYMVAGHGNILNPIDNAAAAINYIKSRYGSVFNVPGIVSMMNGGAYQGYANGTDSASGGWSMVGERGPEAMYVPQGAKIVPNNQLGQSTSQPQIIVQPAPIYLDGRMLSQGLLPHFTNQIRYNVGTHNL